MGTAFVETRRSSRKPPTTLEMWAVGTLAGMILLLIWLQVVVLGGLFPPLAPIFGGPALVVAVIILAVRRAWVPGLAALYWLFVVATNTGHLGYDIMHPESFSIFAFTVLVLALVVVGIAASMTAIARNYRAPAANEGVKEILPRWFSPMIWSVAGLCVGGLLVGALPRENTNPAVSAQALTGLPAVTTTNFKFDPPELCVKVGQVVALRVENRANGAHSFDIDEFNVHVRVNPGQTSLALFTPREPGTYTFYCGEPGHRGLGMVGKLIVEP